MLTAASLARSERDFNPRETAKQIGAMNIMAISGGRMSVDPLGALELPVGAGYTVRVTLAANDTYTVERVFTRRSAKSGPGYTIHRVTDVHCEEVGEVAYQASSFRSYEFGEKVG